MGLFVGDGVVGNGVVGDGVAGGREQPRLCEGERDSGLVMLSVVVIFGVAGD